MGITNFYANKKVPKEEKTAFVKSGRFLTFLLNFVRNMTRMYDLKIIDGSTTATDGKVIYLNRDFEYYLDENLTVATTVLCYIADVMHEAGHLLETLFEIHWAINNDNYDKSHIDPRTRVLIQDEVTNFVKDYTPYERRALADINNIVEDGGMEYQIGTKFGGMVKRALKTSNIVITNRRPTLNEMAAKGASTYDILTAACLDYSVVHYVCGTIEDKKAKKVFEEKLIPLIKEGVYAPTSIERFRVAKKVFLVLLPYLKEKENKKKEQYNEQSKSQPSGNGSESQNGSASDMQSQGASGNSKEKDHRKTSSQNQDGENGQGQDQTPNNSNNGKNSKGQGNSNNGQSNNTKDGNVGENKNDQRNNSSPTNPSSNPNDDEFGNRNPYRDQFDGIIEELNEENAENLSTSARNAINEIRSGQIADEEEKLQEMENSMNFSAKSKSCKDMDMGDCVLHSNIRIKAVPAAKGDEVKYESIVAEHYQTIDMFIDYFKELLRPQRARKFYSSDASTLDQRRLYQTSFNRNVFYEMTKEKTIAPFRVLILIDASGSMRDYKMQMAREAAIVLSEVFETLEIPFSVFTHGAHYPEVAITCYKDFENNNFDKTKLATLDVVYPYQNNRDGAALCFVKEFVRDIQEKVIVLSISDGSPNDEGYRGPSAMEDTRKAAEDLSDVADVIGVAIGDGITKEDIESIYENNVVVENLEDLAAELMDKIEI